jgi:hypothetical protein
VTLDDETIDALGYASTWSILDARALDAFDATAEWRERMRRERAACRERGEVHPSDVVAAERALRRRARLLASPEAYAEERAKNTARQRARRARLAKGKA